jgi:hypothetical protein
MLPLLSQENESFRGWAAAHALEFAPEAGEAQLQSLARGIGIAALRCTDDAPGMARRRDCHCQGPDAWTWRGRPWDRFAINR